MLARKTSFSAVCFIAGENLSRKCKYANLHEAYKALVRVPIGVKLEFKRCHLQNHVVKYFATRALLNVLEKRGKRIFPFGLSKFPSQLFSLNVLNFALHKLLFKQNLACAKFSTQKFVIQLSLTTAFGRFIL